jgi:hypothetical protein
MFVVLGSGGIADHAARQRSMGFSAFLVALARCGDLLFCAKHLFVAAIGPLGLNVAKNAKPQKQRSATQRH